MTLERQRRIGWLLLTALGLAVPGALITIDSFQPVDVRLELSRERPAVEFSLPSSDPLFLQYALTVRSPSGAHPTLILELNNVAAATLRASRFYAPESGRVALASAVHTGPNNLRLMPGGTPDIEFALSGRLHNYYGIAPDFPRLVVLDDASDAAMSAQRSWRAAAVRFGAIFVAALLLAWAVRELARAAPPTAQAALTVSLVVLPWSVLIYSVTTPLHVRLSYQAFGVAALAGWLVTAAGLWLVKHRVAALKAAAVILVSVGALEIALRAFNAVKPSFIFYSSDYNRYRGHPGELFLGTRFNSRGFNDVERSIERPAAVAKRVVALGDSFAVGVVPRADNFLTRLQGVLGPAGTAEVVNLGISGTGPPDYLALLINEGIAYKPDVVLVCLFIGNDFELPVRKPYEHSYVAMFARALWVLSLSGMPKASTVDGPQQDYRDDQPTMSEERFLEYEVARSWVFETANHDVDAAVARVAATLDTMNEVAARAHAELDVVVIPDETQVNTDLQAAVAAASGQLRGGLDFDRPTRLIMNALAARRIRAIDLLAPFREAGRSTRLYKLRDTHWNIAGNGLAAAKIAEALR